MALTIEIPEEAVRALKMPASEVQVELTKEIALALYSRGALSVGKAAEMAGLRRVDFEQLLTRRRVERPYTATELESDLSWAKESRHPSK
jgi:predicted HTH domain antitoxin